MTANVGGTAKELPALESWDYGGLPYRLEPLLLPMPEVDALVEDERAPSSAAVTRACALLDADDGRRAALPEPQAAAAELFWFRWIIGHQVSFIIWQLMARVIARLSRTREPAADLFDATAQYIRGYSAMLLYTSSCSREIYTRIIRPSMFLQHRAFSGTWALDYRPVRELLRGKKLAWLEGAAAAETLREVRLCHLVHDGVAAKLVPQEQSLLQGAGLHGGELHDWRLLGAIYDDYFMTTRAEVALDDVVAQLLRRLGAISHDVSANGLDPLPGGDELPAGLRGADVVDLEHDFARVLFRVAAFAAGLTSRQVNERLALVR